MEKWISEGWDILNDQERAEIEERVENLFVDGLPFELEHDKAIYFSDSKPEFDRAMEQVFQLGLNGMIKIDRPFIGLTKSEVLRRGSTVSTRTDIFLH